MYQNLANQNPILNQFNGYMVQNPCTIPFQGNQLISGNVHVMNNLNDYIQQHREVQQKMPIYQQLQNNQINQINQINQMGQTKQLMQMNDMSTKNNKQNHNTRLRNDNIIEQILKPQIITKNNNKDVGPNFEVRENIQKQVEDGIFNIKITNAPYKNIIKDRIIVKNVEDIVENDLLVHKSIRGKDDRRDKFDKRLSKKEKEKEEINEEIEIEFHIDNYDTHKKKYDYKETFIRNLAFEENTFDESKEDYIDFYRQKQKEAEEGIKLCDQIYQNIKDDGIISKDELPANGFETENTEIDLKSIVNNILMDDDSSNKPTKKTEPKQNPMTKKKINIDTIIDVTNQLPKTINKNIPKSSMKNSNKNVPKSSKTPIKSITSSQKSKLNSKSKMNIGQISKAKRVSAHKIIKV